MTDSMIETVARAAYERMIEGIKTMHPIPGQEFPDEKWDGLAPELQQHWRDIARAAIAAMREPTEAMLEAGTTHGITAYRCTMTQLRHGDAEETWWAMIDAALKEP